MINTTELIVSTIIIGVAIAGFLFYSMTQYREMITAPKPVLELEARAFYEGGDIYVEVAVHASGNTQICLKRIVVENLRTGYTYSLPEHGVFGLCREPPALLRASGLVRLSDLDRITVGDQVRIEVEISYEKNGSTESTIQKIVEVGLRS